jgi:hypothetical protein
MARGITLTEEKKYRCQFCGKEYDRILYKDQCEKSHEVVYIPVLKEDLSRLVQFIFTGDRKLLNERLGRTIMEYFRKFH